MKNFVLSVLCLFGLTFGYAQACPNPTVRVVTFVTVEALAYSNGQAQTLPQLVQAAIDQANAANTTSGVSTQYENMGTYHNNATNNEMYCCGPSTHLYEGSSDMGAVWWARNDIRLQRAKETLGPNGVGADVVLIITKYPNDVSGARFTCPTHLGPAQEPRNAIAGMDAAWLYAAPHLLSYELSRILCVQPQQAHSHKSGTDAGNCTSWWTLEWGINLPPNYDQITNSNCWRAQDVTATGCYPTGSAALRAFWGNLCQWSGGYHPHPNIWSEVQTCSQIPTNRTAYKHVHSFTCPNAGRINQFSNPNVLRNGVPTGDASKNAAATMNAFGPTVSCNRNAPRPSKRMEAAAGVVLKP